MLFTHKIKLKPNHEQRLFFAKSAGIARFAYNWALDTWKKQYEAWKEDNSLPKPTAFALCKEFNAIKKEKFPFVLEVSSRVPDRAIINLGNAMSRFMSNKAKYPRFKSKGIHDSFYCHNSSVTVDGKRVKLSKIGWVRMHQELRFKGKIMSATVSRTADDWFISICVETDIVPKLNIKQPAIGVDLGIKTLATLSNGEEFENPRPLKNNLKKIKRLQRQLARQTKGGSNYKKTKMKLARAHARVSNIRKYTLHNLTSYLTKNFEVIGIEDLNVSGMMKNQKLSQAIGDIGAYEFKRQVEYKSDIYQSKFITVDRFYPSSKLCSCCGYKMETMPLNIREWTCPNCSSHHNRDKNAARNIELEAVKIIKEGRHVKKCKDVKKSLTPKKKKDNISEIAQ